MPIYNKFASVYDTMNADRHSVQMVDYCKKIFKKFKIKPKTGLDLCCGTGTAISKLSELGIRMSGLDQSAQMLAVAAKKLKGKNVTLYQKELPGFRLLDKNDSKKKVTFDLVTSFYDSLNYMLTESKLKQAFISTAKHLNHGGYFIFDMNTPTALKTIWDEQTYAGKKDDMAWIWENEYNPSKKQAICKATFFKKKGNLWERFEEEHHEQGYANTTIKKLLRSSGFALDGFYECRTFDNPTRESYRVCAVARKR
ncbi:MAG: methyltransferase domain-containing protein [Calditrichaeota bacterium]|nr:MAG: methyltransferase domain-containing protein [Calditrichota bacterium]